MARVQASRHCYSLPHQQVVKIQECELINVRWVMFVTLSALSSNGSRGLLGKTQKGGAGRWVVLGADTTVLHLNVDRDRGVSDWLHRVPTQS
ncbi:unnamed protein product [Brassica oleracea var. botrytis]